MTVSALALRSPSATQVLADRLRDEVLHLAALLGANEAQAESK